MKDKLFFYFTKYKTVILILLFFFAIIILITINSITPRPTKTTTPQPVIPTDSSKSQLTPPNVLPKKTLNFIWNNTKIDLPTTAKIYSINKPLINFDTVTLLSKSLGFTSSDLLKSKIETNRTWENSKSSLFSSINQNQIIFRNKFSNPAKSSKITKDEAVAVTKSILSLLLGEDFVKTLDNNVKIRFLKFDPTKYSPDEVSTYTSAEYIEVSYKQLVDSSPLSSLSGNTNTLLVVIDNQKNLYRLEIYGGFYELSSQGESSIIDINTLKSSAINNALKISSMPDVSIESIYLNSTNITVNVDNSYFGYFLTADNNVIPAIYISGTATTTNLPSQPITFVVSATK